MTRGNAIGVIELASLHMGFAVLDEILEMTQVEKILARTICSGKYLIIVRSTIADVEECLEVAREKGGFAIVSALMIPNIDERVFPALAGSNTLDRPRVDGMLILETFSVATAIKAADFALKEADINLLRIHAAMAIGGKGLVVMTGNIDALKSAVEPAVEFAKEEGMLAGYSLITDPHEDILRELI